MALHASKDQKKHAAVRRAQFALSTALARIDYMEDVVKPELEAMAEGRAHLNSEGDYVQDAVKALKKGELPE